MFIMHIYYKEYEEMEDMIFSFIILINYLVRHV